MVEYDQRRWWAMLFQLRGSVVPKLFPRLLITAAIGLGAAYLFLWTGFKLPATAHALIGVALGLLLVFRTNASYDRFWEGRKLTGAMVNRARNAVRKAATFIDGDDAEAVKAREEVRRLVVVLYALIRQYLRKERNLDELRAPVTPEEKAALEPVRVRPNLAATWLSDHLTRQARQGRITEDRLRVMDDDVTAFVDYWGGCERILKTPLPFAYAQHIKGFVTLFCFTVPFALVESLRWGTPLVAAIVAYGLFGIEEIGVEIEDPFGYDANDLPLDAMGDTIANDTGDILRNRDGARASARAA